MTLVAGVRGSDGVLYIGSDRGVVDSTISYTITTPKVVVSRGIAIGTAGLYRAVQVVSRSFVSPPRKRGEDLHTYLTTRFVDKLWAVLDDSGHVFQKPQTPADDGGYATTTGEWLVGVDGRLFVIDESFSVMESNLPFAAIGSSTDIALGALAALTRKKVKPETALRETLEIATLLSPTIRSPYDIFELAPRRPLGKSR